MYRSTCRLLLLLSITAGAWAAPPPEDPLDSSQWPTMYRSFFDGQPLVFDDKVDVLVPPEAEDSLNVPVAVRYEAVEDPRQVLLFVDYNPIPKVLDFYPQGMEPFLGVRLRLQQATPVRAAVRDGAGVWHLNGAWVDAAGGGCTLPDMEAAGIDEDQVGQVHGRVWTREDGSQRIKLRVTHPNDTGLVFGAPAYYVEELEINDAGGNTLASLNTYEPLCESPVFSLDVAPEHTSSHYRVRGRDNQGLPIRATLEAGG